VVNHTIGGDRHFKLVLTHMLQCTELIVTSLVLCGQVSGTRECFGDFSSLVHFYAYFAYLALGIVMKTLTCSLQYGQ
jgi:hypothetical protein